MMAWISLWISDSSFSLVLLLIRANTSSTLIRLTQPHPYRSQPQKTNVPILFDCSTHISLKQACASRLILAKLTMRSDFIGYSELGWSYSWYMIPVYHHAQQPLINRIWTLGWNSREGKCHADIEFYSWLLSMQNVRIDTKFKELRDHLWRSF